LGHAPSPGPPFDRAWGRGQNRRHAIASRPQRSRERRPGRRFAPRRNTAGRDRSPGVLLRATRRTESPAAPRRVRPRARLAKYAVVEEINERGLRGPEVPYRKPEDEYRVLLLGDSFAEGYTVAFEDTLGERLAAELDRRSDRRYQVINAGTGGYSTDQELLFFRREGSRYEPDLTILLFYVNDITPNAKPVYSRFGYVIEKPLFSVEAGELQLVNVPLTLQPRKVLDTRSDLGVWRRHSLVLRLLARWRNVPALYGAAFRLGLVEAESDVAGTLYEPEEILGWSMTLRLLEALHRETREAGSRFVVFYVPTRSLGEGDVRLAAALAEFARERDLPFVDPVEPMRDETRRLRSETGRGLYFPRDGHWNEHGHRVAARLLAEFLATSVLP
jgi:hypothetical protein